MGKIHGFIPDRPIGKGVDRTWRLSAKHKSQASRSNRRKAARKAK